MIKKKSTFDTLEIYLLIYREEVSKIIKGIYFVKKSIEELKFQFIIQKSWFFTTNYQDSLVFLFCQIQLESLSKNNILKMIEHDNSSNDNLITISKVESRIKCLTNNGLLFKFTRCVDMILFGTINKCNHFFYYYGVNNSLKKKKSSSVSKTETIKSVYAVSNLRLNNLRKLLNTTIWSKVHIMLIKNLQRTNKISNALERKNVILFKDNNEKFK